MDSGRRVLTIVRATVTLVAALSLTGCVATSQPRVDPATSPTMLDQLYGDWSYESGDHRISLQICAGDRTDAGVFKLSGVPLTALQSQDEPPTPSLDWSDRYDIDGILSSKLTVRADGRSIVSGKTVTSVPELEERPLILNANPASGTVMLDLSYGYYDDTRTLEFTRRSDSC